MATAEGAATNFTTNTETLTTQIKTLLSTAQTSWNCHVCSCTSVDDVVNYLHGLRGPAAVVIYMGSQWRTARPSHRKPRFDIALICDNGQMEAGGTTIRGMLDSAVAALDMQQYEQCLVRCVEDAPQDIGMGRSCVRLAIEIEDN